MHLLLIIICLFSACQQNTTCQQSNNVHLLTTLDKSLEETSGLIWFDNSFWTINDSGGEAAIYRLDAQKGTAMQTVQISNGKNVDWEDMTQDDKHIYIGDTGNNRGSRRSFTIYKIQKSDLSLTKPKQWVTAQKIHFNYKDQPRELTPYAHNFDCEALVSIKGQLYIFSKNWQSHTTTYYLINEKTGQAIRQGSLNTDGLITGADYHVTDDQLVLSGYSFNEDQLFDPFIGIVTSFTQNVSHQFKKISLPTLLHHQVEGVCFTPQGIFFTNENSKLQTQANSKKIPPSLHQLIK
ncbi:hypothetical protein DMA11_14815 [Marinilabiliaceae bacterium JC017]|nr:hypothetical protein DMA11_14815 [Marinilabiliaceae bacterium JC017]